MTQGPRSVPQVTPQLLTPSQLMGAERDHRKAGLRGCSWLHSLPGLTSRRLLVHPVTLIRSQGPRPGHMHISYPGCHLRFRAGHRPRVREVRHGCLLGLWSHGGPAFSGAGSCRDACPGSVTAPAQVWGDGLCAETGGVASGCCQSLVNPRTLCPGPCQLQETALALCTQTVWDAIL